MKLITIKEFKDQLDKRLQVSHLGNLQIQVGDKLLLHYVQPSETDYNEDDIENLISMEMSIEFYGEHHDVTLKKDDYNDGYFEDVWAEGELIESLSTFIENDFQEYIKVLWEVSDHYLN